MNQDSLRSVHSHLYDKSVVSLLSWLGTETRLEVLGSGVPNQAPIRYYPSTWLNHTFLESVVDRCFYFIFAAIAHISCQSVWSEF